MFDYYHEISFETKAPVVIVWNYLENTENWKNWLVFERFEFNGPLKKGSKLRAKVKNKNIYFTMTIETLDPLRECMIKTTGYMLTQKSNCTLEELSSKITRVHLQYSVRGLFVPLLESKIAKLINQCFANFAHCVKNLESNHPPLTH